MLRGTCYIKQTVRLYIFEGPPQKTGATRRKLAAHAVSGEGGRRVRIVPVSGLRGTCGRLVVAGAREHGVCSAERGTHHVGAHRVWSFRKREACKRPWMRKDATEEHQLFKLEV